MSTKSPPSAAFVPPLVPRLQPIVELTDDQLLRLSSLNGELAHGSRGSAFFRPPKRFKEELYSQRKESFQRSA
jgi:hypothetical protein